MTIVRHASPTRTTAAAPTLGHGVRRAAERGGARARGGRRRRDPVRRARVQRLHGRGARTGASRRCTARSRGSRARTAVHICYGYGIKANIDWKRTLGAEWRQYEVTSRLLARAGSARCRSSAPTRACRSRCIGLLDGQGHPARRDRRRGHRESRRPEQVAAVHPRRRWHTSTAERLLPCTNCGMVPLAARGRLGKLHALAAGAALVRRELGAPDRGGALAWSSPAPVTTRGGRPLPSRDRRRPPPGPLPARSSRLRRLDLRDPVPDRVLRDRAGGDAVPARATRCCSRSGAFAATGALDRLALRSCC